MTYTKQVWIDGVGSGTPVNANRLTYIEDGIELASRNATTTLAGNVILADQGTMDFGTSTTRVPPVSVVAAYVAANAGTGGGGTTPVATTSTTGTVTIADQTVMNAGTDANRVPPVSVIAAYVAAHGGGGGGTSPVATLTTTGTVTLADLTAMNGGTSTTRVPPVSVIAAYVAANAGSTSPATTGALGTVTLATQGVMDTGTDTSKVPPVAVVASYVANHAPAVPVASTTVTGTVTVADQSTMNTGTSTVKVPPVNVVSSYVASSITTALAAPPLPPAYTLQGMVLQSGEAIPSGAPDGLLIFDRAVASTSYLTGAGTTFANGGASIVLTLTRTVWVSQLLVIGVAFGSVGSASTVTVTDSRGNSYNVRAQQNQGSTVQTAIVSCRITVPLSIGDQVTVSSSNTETDLVVVSAVADGILVSPFDVSTTAGSASTTAVSVGPITTTAAPEIAFALVGFTPTGRTFTPTGSWVAAAAAQTTDGTPIRAQLMYKVLSATGSQTATGTLSVAGAYSGVLATYKGA